MAARTERWTLNHLIQTCRDGERGFRYAANHAANPVVKALFLQIATQRQEFAEDLLPHAHRFGGETRPTVRSSVRCTGAGLRSRHFGPS